MGDAGAFNLEIFVFVNDVVINILDHCISQYITWDSAV